MANPYKPARAITTPYGKAGWSCGFHTGADFAAPMGERIYAPIAGDIRHRNYGSAFGNHQFAISPDPGKDPFGDGEVFFAHTRTRLRDGTRVEVGDFIAETGSEGNSSGPHLHYEYHPHQKGTWGCGVVANPQPTIDHQAGGDPGDGGGGWMFPSGHKVYQKYLKYKGHEQNSDGVSDSIKAWQEMLNAHPLDGGTNLPVTGRWFDMTDSETRKCQGQHIPPADPAGQAWVGPKQFEHVKTSVGAPYVWVADEDPPEPPPPPPTETVELLPGATYDPVDGMDGLRPFASGGGFKVVLHTTESSGKPDWQAKRSGLPHVTFDPDSGARWQHLSLDVAAYTLKGGDHSPNSDAGVSIQIEMIGFAREVGNWPTENLDRLRLLVADIAAMCGVDRVPIPFEFVYDTSGTQVRQGWDTYRDATGLVGHMHVPYNDHHDPGDIDEAYLLGDPGSPPEPPSGGGDEELRAILVELFTDIGSTLIDAAEEIEDL